MKKKLVGVLLCATMILTACGSSNESNVSNTVWRAVKVLLPQRVQRQKKVQKLLLKPVRNRAVPLR